MDTWTPEPFDFTHPPKVASTFQIDRLSATFPRAAKWSPDGSAIIAQCEDNTFRRYVTDGVHATKENERILAQAAPILDFTWFPTASAHDPASFCFVASVRECPVKLLDASDGRLRASYPIVDHRERQIAPHSLSFNLTAQRLYCGFEEAIEVFDISRPGEGTRIRTTPNKKSKEGLKGIISALAFSPTHTSDEAYFAAGSFTPSTHNIALFSDIQDHPMMFLGGGPRAGVTQIQFNSTRPHIVYAAYRGSGAGSIYSWDIRSNVDKPVDIFWHADWPSAKTNQKVRFDIDLAGRMLGIGDKSGNISIFGLQGEDSSQNLEVELSEGATRTHKTMFQYEAHNDVVGSVAFHPFKPLMLSVSGSRHFTKYDDSDSSSEEDLLSTARPRVQPVTFDSTISIWNFEQQGEHAEGAASRPDAGL